MKFEPKPARRIWIVRRFGGQLWSSHIFTSEKTALNWIIQNRKRDPKYDAYAIGPYALPPKKRSTSPTSVDPVKP